MPNRLKGLPGLNYVSEEERNAFMLANEDKLKQYAHKPKLRDQAAEILYNNRQFINKFGQETFDKLNNGSKEAYEYRNNLLRSTVINDAFNERFHDDNDFMSLSRDLDEQGKLDLLTNEEYLGSQERQRRIKEGIDRTTEAQRQYKESTESGTYNPMNVAIDAFNVMKSSWSASRRNNKDAESDKEIRDRLFAETQERREKDSKETTDAVYAGMIQADMDGQKSLAETYDEFDKMAQENSPHYATFKDSDWMKDYSHEDRLKDYAQYQVLKQQYGEDVAKLYLDRTMQNRVAEAQDGKWTGNTLKGVLTTVWSDLGSNYALLSHLGASPERVAIWNQGKDPDKPIYDDKGNIVDYETNKDWTNNPAYWNDVYKYNTFSPTEIQAIKERGGISEDTNVYEYGYTPEFLSWQTAQEGFKQGGHVIAGIIETGLTGATGKVVGLGAKAAMKGIGLSAKAMSKAAKAGNVTNDLFVMATTGIEGAQLEAMGTFDEMMQSSKEKIQQQIRHELADYQRSIDYNSDAAKAGIASYYQQLKDEDNRRVARTNLINENGEAFPMSDEYLMAQAKQMYTNDLLTAKGEELEELHRKDEIAAANAAAAAYGTNFVMDYIKNIPLTVGIQKYKIAKGSMRGAFDNTVNKNIIANLETGGVKRAVNKAGDTLKRASAKNIAKEVIKQIGGGFADEYFDGLNASFASGIGSNEFDNYLNKTYNPESYNAVVDGMLGNLLAGLSEGIEGITDRQNLYEGSIGAVAPGAMVNVNVNALFNPKDTWRALVQGTDEYGNKLDFVERMSKVIMNPLLDSYVNLKNEDRMIDDHVNAINSVVSSQSHKIDDAAKILTALGDYSSPVHELIYSEDTPISLLDSKDQKLYNTFTLIETLNSLEVMEGGKNSGLYSELLGNIQGIAEGTLSEDEMNEEIDKFLADPANKSILDSDNSREIAAERLQKNAKYFMDMKSKMSEIQDMFSKSQAVRGMDPRVQTVLMHNLVASDDYKKRLEELEEGLSIGKTDTERLFAPNMGVRYGTAHARTQAISARDRLIKDIEEQKNNIKEQNEQSKKKIEDLQKSLETAEEDKIQDVQNDIVKQLTLIASRNFQDRTLSERKTLLEDEKKAISSLKDDTLELTEADILAMDARDRAAVLDPKNRGNFTKEQQKVIDHTLKNLRQKDPEALTKILDAGKLAERILDLSTTYNRLMDNDKLAVNFLDAKQNLRLNAAMAESLQSDIEQYYTDIEKGYADRESNPKAFRDSIMKANTRVVEAFMKDNPDKAEAVRPFYEMLQFDEDAAAIIGKGNEDPLIKQAQIQTILGLQEQSSSKEELISKIEGLIDSPDVGEEVKKTFDDLLSKLTTLGHQRDTAVLESRKQRKEREEAEKKEREEAKKKVLEEAKEAAKKKTDEEIANSRDASEDAVTSREDSDDIFGDETPSEVKPEEEIEKKSVPKVPSDLMKDDAEENTVNAGQMWYPSNSGAKKGNFTVSLIKPNDNIQGIISFEMNGRPHTLAVKADEWEVDETSGASPSQEELEEQKTNPNQLFFVKSIDKIDGQWYFNGNFDGGNKSIRVKAKAGFDLDSAVERQRRAREAAFESEGVDVGNPNLVKQGQDIAGKSETLEEEMSSLPQGAEVSINTTGNTMDADTEATVNEKIFSGNPDTLDGNAMREFENDVLVKDGKLVHKKGAKPDDSMNKYFNWLRAAGVNIQKTIDEDLGRILKENPHAKVKFMIVKRENNATHDIDMKSHLFLVLEYNDSENRKITSIHPREKGGILRSGDKEYLVIGTVGFGPDKDPKTNPRIALRDILFNWADGIAQQGMKKFFDAHPEERFYVREDLSTEIIPRSLFPGRRVKQLESDSKPNEKRSIVELVENPDRNPIGLRLGNLKWGIQKAVDFAVVGTDANNVMPPSDPANNEGRVFVLIPAANGKYIPGAIDPLFYQGMKDGVLKNKVKDAIQRLIAPVGRSDYQAKREALAELAQIFLFTDDNTILLSPDGKTITIKRNGIKSEPPFRLDETFNEKRFKDEFESFNPRVNITLRVLSNPNARVKEQTLREYAEAGALNTDIAMLSAANATYSIYALRKDGSMIIPEQPVTFAPQSTQRESYKDKSQVRVLLGTKEYYYSRENNAYKESGSDDVITDADLIKDLDYNREIVERSLNPVAKTGDWNYYILDDNLEHPKVIKVHKNTKKVVEATTDQAIELINRIKKEEDDKRRAAQALMEMNSKPKETAQPAVQQAEEKKDQQGVESKREEVKEESNDKIADKLKNTGTVSFSKLMNDKGVRNKLFDVLKANGFDSIPRKVSELEELLGQYGIALTNIDTSEDGVKAWLHDVQCKAIKAQ